MYKYIFINFIKNCFIKINIKFLKQMEPNSLLE